MRKARTRDDEQAISSFERTRKSRSVPLNQKRTTHYGNTIRRYREMSGMDQKTVGESLGYSTNTISNWENGVSRPDIDAIPRLCELLRIPLNVFFDVEHDPAAPQNEIALIKDFRMLGNERQRAVLQLTHQLAKSDSQLKQAIKRLRQCISLPVQPLSAAAGTGAATDDRLPAPERIFVIENHLASVADAIYTVNGDSMEPTYRNGDLVYVQHTHEIKPKEIGIFIVSGAPYIKEYRKTGLYSHNRAYRMMKLTDDDDVRLIGKVLGRVETEDLVENELQKL